MKLDEIAALMADFETVSLAETARRHAAVERRHFVAIAAVYGYPAKSARAAHRRAPSAPEATTEAPEVALRRDLRIGGLGISVAARKWIDKMPDDDFVRVAREFNYRMCRSREALRGARIANARSTVSLARDLMRGDNRPFSARSGH